MVFPLTRFCSLFSCHSGKEHFIKWEGSFPEQVLSNRNLLILLEFKWNSHWILLGLQTPCTSNKADPLRSTHISWFSDISSVRRAGGEMWCLQNWSAKNYESPSCNKYLYAYKYTAGMLFFKSDPYSLQSRTDGKPLGVGYFIIERCNT